VTFNPDNPDEHSAQPGLFSLSAAPTVDVSVTLDAPAGASGTGAKRSKRTPKAASEVRDHDASSVEDVDAGADPVVTATVVGARPWDPGSQLDTVIRRLDSIAQELGRVANGIAAERAVIIELMRSLPNTDGILRAVKALYLLDTGRELDDVLDARGGKPLNERTIHEHLGTPFDGDVQYNPPTGTVGAAPTNTAPSSSEPSCPKCGSPMRLRSSKRGPFYGCSTYPECKGTRPAPSAPLTTDDVPESEIVSF